MAALKYAVNATCKYKPFWFILIPSTGNEANLNEDVKMTTITIAYEVSQEKLQQIEQLVAAEEIHNVNFNGEDFSVGRGDFTSIDKEDADYLILLSKINEIINGN
ncbi:hypothetical protein [Serratia proteamaculans]